MQLNKNTNSSYTARQPKLSLEIEKLTGISDPVYIFCEVMDHIGLLKYFVANGYETGRPRCDEHKLFKVIFSVFMEHGISSLRDIEKLCRNDIRYLYLLDSMKAPSFATFGSLTRKELTDSIEQIFLDINTYISQKDHADLEHVHLNGTKIETSASRYAWVWKKSHTKSRGKAFEKISMLLDAMNQEILGYLNLKPEKREEYVINYVSELLELYRKGTGPEESMFVPDCGHRESIYQKQYQELQGYLERLKIYAHHIEICGEERSSYSRADHNAAFIWLKRDCMKDDQLLPTYNFQTAVYDEYITIMDVKPYASDTECLVPLMEKLHRTYGRYPKCPVADAGCGSYNSHLYYEEHGMEKYMKFTMFRKETKDKKYYGSPYRAVNSQRDRSGNLFYPVEREFRLKYRRPVYKNQYGRTEEPYECESCRGCEYRNECSPKASDNRTICMSGELIAIHQEVLSNLEPTHRTLLRMNRSIQAEGTFRVLKWDRSYKRLFRRDEKNATLEFTLISYRSNICKYHNKGQ